MRLVAPVLLLLGLVLFGFVLAQADLGEVWMHIRQLEWWGFIAILALYVVSVAMDVGAWLLFFHSLAPKWINVIRLFPVHMAGEALNVVTPGAPFGGEPLKAILLKNRYQVPYQETVSSQILIQSILVATQVGFVFVGFGIMLWLDLLDGAYRTGAGLALVFLTFGLLMVITIQRYAILSRFARRIGGSVLKRRIAALIRQIHQLENRLIHFYRREPGRIAAACFFELGNWILGAVEIYLICYLLGHPISLSEAWVIESVVFLVRMVLFAVPIGIGAQEGAFFVICDAITGVPSLGVALALIRRARELTWISLGLALGLGFSYRYKPAGLEELARISQRERG